MPGSITTGADKMKIAVLSGKGGTGKTLISVNLAATAREAVYIDCDVEEPNGHLFFKPREIESEAVSIAIPIVDPSLCQGCRTCVDFCKFNALAYINGEVRVFEEVCHSCGGCALLCPQKAIGEEDKDIGQVRRGVSDTVSVISGILNPGEASGVPIIKQLLSYAREEDLNLIDCPPGSACIVMETIMDADYCILVAEPTIYGVHNLGLVQELVKLFHKPHGVVLNKCLEEENPAEKFCREEGINILAKIPLDSELGRLNSDGLIVTWEEKRYHSLFSDLLDRVKGEVGQCSSS